MYFIKYSVFSMAVLLFSNYALAASKVETGYGVVSTSEPFEFFKDNIKRATKIYDGYSPPHMLTKVKKLEFLKIDLNKDGFDDFLFGTGQLYKSEKYWDWFVLYNSKSNKYDGFVDYTIYDNGDELYEFRAGPTTNADYIKTATVSLNNKSQSGLLTTQRAEVGLKGYYLYTFSTFDNIKKGEQINSLFEGYLLALTEIGMGTVGNSYSAENYPSSVVFYEDDIQDKERLGDFLEKVITKDLNIEQKSIDFANLEDIELNGNKEYLLTPLYSNKQFKPHSPVITSNAGNPDKDTTASIREVKDHAGGNEAVNTIDKSGFRLMAIIISLFLLCIFVFMYWKKRNEN